MATKSKPRTWHGRGKGPRNGTGPRSKTGMCPKTNQSKGRTTKYACGGRVKK